MRRATTWALTALTLTLFAPTAQAEGLRDVITQKTLDNGLTVIVIEDHSVPLVTVEIAVKNGAFTEPPEFNGLSHLYEHMFFKGNAVITTQEAYLKRIRELGISFNGTTSTERVNYYFTLPSAKLGEGMVFMRDAITTPKFDEKEFTKEIQVVIGEVDRNESNPYYWIGQAVEAKLWHAHPTRKDSLGDRETITTATVEKMKVMKERYYVPNNSVLLISGDVAPEAAFAMAQKEFSAWKPSAEDPHVTYPVPAHPPLPGTSAVVVNKDVRVPYVSLNWHGPSVADDPKATYAADVLSYILGQPTSKFYKKLIDSGVTLGAGLSYYTQRYTGPISASAQTKPENVEATVRALLNELYDLTDPAYFTDEQLASAKKILAIQSIYEREKASAMVHTVSFWWCVAGLDYYLDYVDNLNAVTREDISAYVTNYIIGKPFVVGLLISEAAGKQHGLDEASFAELVAKIDAEVRAERAE
jgi:zinc protease